jgi:DNA-binding NtrC family response regulator
LFKEEHFSRGGPQYVSDKTKTILVVEDVDEISNQMNEMLRRKGHQILSAANAEEAIRIAEHDHPCMILTDLDLPTFDSLVQLVRAHKDLFNTPVAVIDINGHDTEPPQDVKILSDFDQLDYFLESCAK